MKKVTVIGGGLSGLITAIQLVRANIPVVLFEKKNYPFHRVCGEYISNETVPFLLSLNLYPEDLNPSSINSFQLTSVSGKGAQLPLELGGFGISRYAFDSWLFKKAQHEGVKVYQGIEINKISFQENQFELHSHDSTFTTDVVIGCFGKRSKLDATMGRSFIKKRSPYIGIKYHVRNDHPAGVIALHNFQDGYCGISNVENGISNLCYLSHRNNLVQSGDIKTMEENILYQNPFIKNIFNNSDFLLTKPETINEISFETKKTVEDHVLMCGDAAGMITPLCGNGMAIAIHSSKILSELVIRYCTDERFSRTNLETEYEKLWARQFATRLWAGRQLQNFFGSASASNLTVAVARQIKPLGQYLISKTHGKSF